jgi:head-tail adaptor
MKTPRKTFRQQVTARIETLIEELESMRASHAMVKTQAARDAIQANIEKHETNLRLLRGF